MHSHQLDYILFETDVIRKNVTEIKQRYKNKNLHPYEIPNEFAMLIADLAGLTKHIQDVQQLLLTELQEHYVEPPKISKS